VEDLKSLARGGLKGVSLAIIGAVLLKQNDEWQLQHR
jgi:hypothetical protein